MALVAGVDSSTQSCKVLVRDVHAALADNVMFRRLMGAGSGPGVGAGVGPGSAAGAGAGGAAQQPAAAVAAAGAP